MSSLDTNDIRLVLCRAFLEAHPAEAARMLEQVPADEAAALLLRVGLSAFPALLEVMSPHHAAACFSRLPPDEATPVVAAVSLDTAARVLRHASAEARGQLLDRLPSDQAGALRRLLQYPTGSAGALMDPRGLSVPSDITVGEALGRIQRFPGHVRYYVYVVGRTQELLGVVNLRELMMVPGETPIGTVMRRPVLSLAASASRATVLGHPGWREYHALPVVDTAGRFLGVLRYETLRSLERDAGTEPRQQRALGVLLAFGELYWQGLAATLLVWARVVPAPAEGRAPWK